VSGLLQDFGEYASWANWTVGEVTDATLGVESTAASPAAAPLPTPLLRERNLAVQFVAVVMAAASTVAIALVGTLSIGCHAAVMLVAKIGPLRTLYDSTPRVASVTSPTVQLAQLAYSPKSRNNPLTAVALRSSSPVSIPRQSRGL
jgi:hypothetical protein